MCVPQMQNTLPAVSTGPYVTDIPVVMNFDRIGAYRQSTLERTYQWQPHLGFDVGLQLDLVDQDAIAPDTRPDSNGNISMIDRRIVQAAGGVAVGGGGAGTDGAVRTRDGRVLFGNHKPWWLRAPIHLENNLYDNTNKSSGSALVVGGDALLKKLKAVTGDVAEDDRVFIPAVADQSFRDVEEQLALRREALQQEEQWSLDMVPHLELQDGGSSAGSGGRLYSFVRYEEDPLEGAAEAGSRGTDGLHAPEATQRAALEHSIIMNSRPLAASSSSVGAKSTVFAISVVAPPASAVLTANTAAVPATATAGTASSAPSGGAPKGDGADGDDDDDDLFGDKEDARPAAKAEEDDDDDLFGDKEEEDAVVAAKKPKLAEVTSATAAATATSAAASVRPNVPYRWLKDLKSDVQNRALPSTFALFLPAGDSAKGHGQLRFVPLKSQIALRKLAATEIEVRDVVPQEVLVQRRGDRKRGRS